MQFPILTVIVFTPLVMGLVILLMPAERKSVGRWLGLGGGEGVSMPLVRLTGVVIFTGVLISWGIDDRPREFFAFLFVLATGVFGVFVSLDLFMLFFFYEIAVFPMYLLISIWGWQVTREYAAMKLTLYLFIGSVVTLQIRRA